MTPFAQHGKADTNSRGESGLAKIPRKKTENAKFSLVSLKGVMSIDALDKIVEKRRKLSTKRY